MYYSKDMTSYKKILFIENLKLPNDILYIIKMNYKYELLQKQFDANKKNLINHINYYIFLNNKINKRHKRKDSLLKTILFFDT